MIRGAVSRIEDHQVLVPVNHQFPWTSPPFKSFSPAYSSDHPIKTYIQSALNSGEAGG